MPRYQGPIFDVQTHAIVPETYARVAGGLKSSEGLTSYTKTHMADVICRAMADNLTSRKRLETLEGGSFQVVSINTFFPKLPASQLIAICEASNEWMAQATSSNHQLIGIATVPPLPALSREGADAVDQGMACVKRAIEQLGLEGIMVASNYDHVFLGDPVFMPLFALAEKLRVPIIIHPAVQPVEEQFIRRKNIAGLSGFLNDQRTTLLDLVMAGVLENYPKLTIIATHLGGGILSSIGRFDVVSGMFPEELWYNDLRKGRRLLPRSIGSYLKEIYYDCNNACYEDIVHAISKIGEGQLLTGTDFPWMEESAFTRDVLACLGDEKIRLKIAYNNAARLFSRPEV